ncbi:hypothetical protein Tco_0747771 [Tanacetum coccineum]|uniref:Uncharacterized protein n=1 Tax=Tanacetum coccineum TaxID=301880 RepID=A0ABQ4YUM4_9ASTR
MRKVTKGSLVVDHGNKHGSLYMVEVHTEGIGAIIDGSGSAALLFGEAEEGFPYNVREDKETAEAAAGVANGIVMLKMVPKTPLQFGVAERLSRTFRIERMGLRAEAPKMLWAYKVSTAYVIYLIPYVSIGLCIPEEEWLGKDTSLAHLKAAAQMKCDTAFEIRRVTRLSKAVILHLWTRFMEPENDSIVVEHRLSLEIIQSPGGSLDTSEGSKNGLSFEDSVRSDEEESEDGASSKEGGSKTLQNLKVCSWAKLVRILISEGSLSFLKILKTKSLTEMFTRLVMKKKLKLCTASTGAIYRIEVCTEVDYLGRSIIVMGVVYDWVVYEVNSDNF